MTECLDEEAILSFCRGSMAAEKRPAAEAHIAECEECRVLVSAVMRSSLVDPAEQRDIAMAPTTPLQGSFPSSPPTSPVRAGEIVAGKYLVERVLGAGGMGMVVAARHTQLEQRFALKFLLPAAYAAPGALERFIREGKAAAQITSEHVARVVDTGVLDSGAPYLVMEYLEGSDLGAHLATHGRLEPAEVVEYVLQACEAIVEAHQLGIVHRDLKPANLFLARRKDGSPLVKVLDFGISKADGASSQLTSTSTLMGSPRYMSPEQMVSAKDVDARTDIWALGVILHELASGQPVWQADTVQGLCALIATAPAPPLRKVVPAAPAALEAVILRCLEKAPADRPASIADLAVALEPLAPERARTSIERILGVAGRKRPVPSVAPAPAPASPGGRRPVVALLAGAIVVLGGIGVALNLARRAPETITALPSAASSPATMQVPVASTPAEPAPPAVAAPAASADSAPVVKAAAPAKTAKARVPSAPAAPPAPAPEAPSRALSDRK